MQVLVANLGSTSFKFRLFEMESETQIARGAVENIGAAQSEISIQVSNQSNEFQSDVSDHGMALDICLKYISQMTAGELNLDTESFAIGFKAVHGGRYTGVEIVDERVIDEMDRLSDVAPAHNPPYTSAIRLLKKRFPDVPQVVAFETGFHTTAPEEFRTYAIPFEWTEQHQVIRSGFHGASHRYISERMSNIAPDCPRIISCHLGGSSSLCGIKNGNSYGASMGISPQSGLPQSNRCGDFDPFAIPLLMKTTGEDLNGILAILANQSGLKGMSGLSSDLRVVIESAQSGNTRSKLAVDVYVAEVRRHLGGMMMRLNGLDAIVFTGGIGERSSLIRDRVCDSLDEFGIVLDQNKNESASEESRLDDNSGNVQIWTVPTNEEIVVARQTVAALEKNKCL